MSKFMKSLCKTAIPVTLQSMLQASFSIVDQIMIGQLGETKEAWCSLDVSLICGIVISALFLLAAGGFPSQILQTDGTGIYSVNL